MSRIPDPIERGEMRAESWADEHIKGDNFTCQCGAICPLDDGQFPSPDPYSPPVCPKCMEDYFEYMERKS